MDAGRGKTTKYAGITFKSKSEARHYELISIEAEGRGTLHYEAMTFNVRDQFGNLVPYTPDFVLTSDKSQPVLIESKAGYDGLTHDAVIKLQASAKLCHGVPLFVLGESFSVFEVNTSDGRLNSIDNMKEYVQRLLQ